MYLLFVMMHPSTLKTRSAEQEVAGKEEYGCQYFVRRGKSLEFSRYQDITSVLTVTFTICSNSLSSSFIILSFKERFWFKSTTMFSLCIVAAKSFCLLFSKELDDDETVEVEAGNCEATGLEDDDSAPLSELKTLSLQMSSTALFSCSSLK